MAIENQTNSTESLMAARKRLRSATYQLSVAYSEADRKLPAAEKLSIAEAIAGAYTQVALAVTALDAAQSHSNQIPTSPWQRLALTNALTTDQLPELLEGVNEMLSRRGVPKITHPDQEKSLEESDESHAEHLR